MLERIQCPRCGRRLILKRDGLFQWKGLQGFQVLRLDCLHSWTKPTRQQAGRVTMVYLLAFGIPTIPVVFSTALAIAKDGSPFRRSFWTS